MARWILKVHTGESVDEVAETIDSYDTEDIKVKLKLSALNMIVFFAPESDAEILSKDPRVATVVRDAERTLSDISINEYEDADVQTITQPRSTSQVSTDAGEFGETTEYYSHLELIGKRNFDGPNVHKYVPTKTGSGVDCYIVDTGINFNHPYLKGRVNRCPGFSLNLNEKQDADDNGHGTYSALFCAGENCGVAQNATLYSLKVMSSSGSGYNSHILEAINAVTSHHNTKVEASISGGYTPPPSVLNYSIGMMPSVNYPSFVKDVTGDGDYLTLDGLKMATAAGVHVTSAAGNGFFKGGSLKGPMMSTLTNGQMHLTPEESGNADPGQGLPIVVGATHGDSKVYDTDPHKMAYFSNYGKGNTINAPGYRLVSPSRTWEDDEGTSYVWKSGTSFSSPITAGVLALHLEVNPTATPYEAKTWLSDVSTKDELDNLMKSTSLSGGKIRMWDDKQNAHLIYGDIEIPKTENWDNIQISGIDGGDLLYFDDWYPVRWMNDARMAYRMLGNPEENMTIEGDDITFSRLDGTHESTDGIKKWQSESAGNLLIKHEMGESSEYYYIGSVEHTPNVVLFNPYQNYFVTWQNVDTFQYDENGLVGQTPSATIKTVFGEEPFDVSLEYVSGILPCDIGVGGMIQENVIVSNSDTAVIRATNGYAEFEKTIGFEYVGAETENIHLRFYGEGGILDVGTSVSFNQTPSNLSSVVTTIGLPIETPIRVYFLLVSIDSVEHPPSTLKLGCSLASTSGGFETELHTLPYVRSDELYHFYSFPWKMLARVDSLEYEVD
jgi:subtilisin family serine protease